MSPGVIRLSVVTLLAAMVGVIPGEAIVDQTSWLYDDARVANFVAAERMDGDHFPVTLSFWKGAEGKAILYGPRDGSGAVQLYPLGQSADGKGLRVRAPDGSMWIIIPSDGVLLLEDNSTPRPHVFLWQYQGPVDGKGTACRQCIDEKDALPFVMRQFVLDAPSRQQAQ